MSPDKVLQITPQEIVLDFEDASYILLLFNI